MNDLMNTQPTMSTREIAELTDKEHFNVLADVRKMLADLGIAALSFQGRYIDSTGRSLPLFNLPQDLAITLVSGYSVQMRHRVVKRWQELEAIAAPAPAPAELSRMDILKLAMESEQARIKAESERDEAIRTKAQIGSRREASAMAKASAASKALAKAKADLGFCSEHATVTAVQGAIGGEYDWLPLRRWCKANNVESVSVPDKRFGEVKAWPAGAWLASYGVRLGDVFGAAQ